MLEGSLPLHASNDGRITIFAGGIPLKRDGMVVGAIGVSGGSGEQSLFDAQSAQLMTNNH